MLKKPGSKDPGFFCILFPFKVSPLTLGHKKSLLYFRTADFQFSLKFVTELFSFSRVTASSC